MNYKEILFVSPSYKRKGGIASVVSEYKNYIGKDFRHFSTIDYSNNFLNVLFFPFKVTFFIFYLALNREIKIVHIHASKDGSFLRKFIIFIIAKLFFFKKVVYHIHSGKFNEFYFNSSLLLKLLIEKIILHSDCLITLSVYWKDYFETTFEINTAKVVNNIVKKNTNFISNERDLIKFLFLGRINDNKGIFDVMSCLIDNKIKFNNKIKIIIGGDGEVDKLLKIISKNKLENLVKFIGWVSGKDKVKIFQDTDVMLLPSYSEGLPISLLEALSYKFPLVSTNVGGIPEILDHMVNGLVVKPGNKKEITQALQFYIDNKSKIKEHGRASYLIGERFFPKNVFRQLEKIYNSL